MSVLTRVFLLTIVSTVSAIPSYSQESKTGQGSSAPADRPPAVEHNPNAWKEYSSKRGLFTIIFPGTPTDDDNSSGTPSRLEGRKYMLTTTAVYAVYYMDFPADFPNDLEKEGMLRKQWFDNARDATVSQSKARFLDETDIAIDGHPGRLLKLALPGGGILREKQFVVGKRVYQILVITPKESLAPDGGRFDQSRATRFLDSFKLAKPE